MPDLTETQFIGLALVLILFVTLLAMCLVAIMFGAPQDDDETEPG